MKMTTLFAGAVIAVATGSAFAGKGSVVIFEDRDSWGAGLNRRCVLTEHFNDNQTQLPGLAILAGTHGTIANERFEDRIAPGDSTLFFLPHLLYGFGADFDLAGPGGTGFGLGVAVGLFRGGTLVGEIPNSINGGFWGFLTNFAFDAVAFFPGTQVGVAETYNLDNASFLTCRSIPLPNVWMMASAGLLGVGAVRRRSVR